MGRKLLDHMGFKIQAVMKMLDDALL